MNITEKIFAVLSAAPAVIALCPASRIKTYGRQQGLTLPYIFHFGILDETNQTHGEGLAKLKKWQYDVSCFGASYSQAKQLADAVVAVLGSYRQGGINCHYFNEFPMPYDSDVLIEQIVTKFEIWESL